MRKNRKLMLSNESRFYYDLITKNNLREFEFDLFYMAVQVLRKHANDADPSPIMFAEYSARYEQMYFRIHCAFYISKDDLSVDCDITMLNIDEYIKYNLQLENDNQTVKNRINLFDKYLKKSKTNY